MPLNANDSDGNVVGNFTQLPTFASPQALQAIVLDPSLSPTQTALAVQIIRNAEKQTPGPHFTTHDLIKGAIGAGLGYAAGRVTGTIMGAFFGTSPQTQTTLARAGALGGLLRATGIWR